MAALATAGDLITLALKTSGVNGVGQTPLAEDANDSLIYLSSMVAQWQRKRWLVYDDVDVAVVSTGAASYSIGPTSAFAVARPDRLQAAFARILPGVGGKALDYPLAIITAREDYNEIALKSLVTLPAAVFYDSAWPTGTLYFWPVPPAGAYELHVTVPAALPVYANLTDPLNLPAEYVEALIWGLAARLAMAYGMAVNPAHVGAYRAALNTIRQANAQIGDLDMPAGLGGRRGRSVAASASPAFQSGWW